MPLSLYGLSTHCRKQNKVAKHTINDLRDDRPRWPLCSTPGATKNETFCTLQFKIIMLCRRLAHVLARRYCSAASPSVLAPLAAELPSSKIRDVMDLAWALEQKLEGGFLHHFPHRHGCDAPLPRRALPSLTLPYILTVYTHANPQIHKHTNI